jgi:RimJ/RimL family protein N-acetyltransferase
MSNEAEQPFARQISKKGIPDVCARARAAPAPLQGRYIRLEPLDPARHVTELFRAGHDSREALKIWEYLPVGPAPDENAFGAHPSIVAKRDWVTFSLRSESSGQLGGMASYLDIEPLNGVIEIGGVWFSPELQRTRAGTEALFLLCLERCPECAGRRGCHGREAPLRGRDP